MKGASAPPKFLKKINIFFFGNYPINNLKNFKRTLSFWPPILNNIHIYLRKSKNKHKFHLNIKIMLEIQIILQKILQIADVISSY